MNESDISIRDYVDGKLVDANRALLVAEQEREKAARALRHELERSYTEGDERLREHVANQIEQIRGLIESSEKLELARIETIQHDLIALGTQIALALESSKEAIKKQEAATEARFSSVNEFRQTLTDQAAEFVRQDVFDSRLSSNVKRLDGIDLEIDAMRVQQARDTSQHLTRDMLEAAVLPLSRRLDDGASAFAQIRLELAKTDTKDATLEEIKHSSQVFLRWLAVAAIGAVGVIVSALAFLVHR